ncbi:MAG: arabinose isomerase, partial [Eubacterium sp.]|nr:arabinose isomerase [Eubacterium sp.]
MLNRRPKLGLLGLMTGGYEDTFPGILARQEKYAGELVKTMSQVADVTFAGIGTDRAKIEEIVKSYNEAELDGMVIVLLAYSQSMYLLRALENNRLPIALAVVQPDQ